MSNFKKYMSIIQEMEEKDEIDNSENFFIKEFSFKINQKTISGKCIISNKCQKLKNSLKDSPYDYSDEFENGNLGDSIISVVYKDNPKVEPKKNDFDIIIDLPMPGGEKTISIYKDIYPVSDDSLVTIQLKNSFTVQDSFKYNLDIAFFDKENNINYFDISSPFYFELNRKISNCINEYNKKVEQNEKNTKAKIANSSSN